MNPKNLTFFSYEAHSSFIVLFSPLTKHNLLLSIFLENERSFTFLLFCWMIKILLLLWCVSEAAVQYHRHVYSIRNCLFVCFSVTLVKPEKPLKVPEVEKFYKLPDSRAVVEFRINTGFTASCFFGTLLVAFAQIKDFYESIRCSATIVSICGVVFHCFNSTRTRIVTEFLHPLTGC